MVDELELTTAICLFHHVDRAEAAVDQLRSLGLLESEIAVLGDAHRSGSGGVSTPTLRSLRVPEEDIEILMDGLSGGGTIVAVRSSAEIAERVERIFQGQSAELLDEHVVETDALIPSERVVVAAPEPEPIDAIDPLNRVE